MEAMMKARGMQGPSNHGDQALRKKEDLDKPFGNDISPATDHRELFLY